jgi:hypothetical protein
MDSWMADVVVSSGYILLIALSLGNYFLSMSCGKQ